MTIMPSEDKASILWQIVSVTVASVLLNLMVFPIMLGGGTLGLMWGLLILEDHQILYVFGFLGFLYFLVLRPFYRIKKIRKLSLLFGMPSALLTVFGIWVVSLEKFTILNLEMLKFSSEADQVPFIELLPVWRIILLTGSLLFSAFLIYFLYKWSKEWNRQFEDDNSSSSSSSSSPIL